MKKTLSLRIDKSLNGKIVREILINHIKLSKNIVKNLKKYDDGILVNGERVNVLKTVKEGDELLLTMHEKQNSDIAPFDVKIEVLYEDEDIIVFNKPYAMPTHPSRNHPSDTLANAMVHYFKGENITFHAITRLDRDTSGAVLIAKNAYSAQSLGKDMKEKRIIKEYVAVVNGVPKEKSGIIAAPIRRKTEGKVLRCIASDGKEAITKYCVEKENGSFSIVSLFPITGRTHQLRVHMSHIGNPIYGDTMYGALQSGERTRLHCRKISFFHPATHEEMTIEAPLPSDIRLY